MMISLELHNSKLKGSSGDAEVLREFKDTHDMRSDLAACDLVHDDHLGGI